jgi:predicted lipoprotein
MAGKHRTARSWAALGALTLGAVATQPSGCAEDAGELSKHSTEVGNVLAQVLEDTWPEVVSPALGESRRAVKALLAATGAWTAALEAGDEGTTEREAAQGAWRVAMGSWQRMELMQLGPAGASLTTVGGQDLRDEIYSWPTTNPCRVDQETAEEDWGSSDFFELNLVNITGLDAMEVLLFGSLIDNACPPQVPPNSDGAWQSLGETGVALNKARYGLVLATQILSHIEAIDAGWTQNGFAADLASAGTQGSPFPTEEDGLNAIFDALFYLELRTKDRKLAWPLGLKDCGLDDCTGMIESPLSGESHQHIAENLAGFEALYTGGEGAGLSELMIAIGQTQIHLDLTEALSSSQTQAAELGLPLDQALTDDPDQIQALHDAVKAVTDVLKNDLATMLMLQVPSEAAGDND